MFRGSAGAKGDETRSNTFKDRVNSRSGSVGSVEEGDSWMMDDDTEDALREAPPPFSRLRPAKRLSEAQGEEGINTSNEAIMSHSVRQCPECTIVVQRGDTVCFMCGSTLHSLERNSPVRVVNTSSTSKQWACARCTYYNAQGSNSCEMCGSLRQEDFAISSSKKATLSTSSHTLEASSSSTQISNESKGARPGRILSRLRRLNDVIVDVPSSFSSSSAAFTHPSPSTASDMNRHRPLGESSGPSQLYRVGQENEEPVRISKSKGIVNEPPMRSDPTTAPHPAPTVVTKHIFRSASLIMKSAGSNGGIGGAARALVIGKEGSSDGSVSEEAGILSSSSSSSSSSSHGSCADDVSSSEDDSSVFIEAEADNFEDDIEDVSSDEAIAGGSDVLWGDGRCTPSQATYTIQHTNGRADYVIKSYLAEECPELRYFVSVRELMSIKGSTHLDFNVFSLSHASAQARRNYDKRRAVNEKPVSAVKRKRPSKRSYKRKKT